VLNVNGFAITEDGMGTGLCVSLYNYGSTRQMRWQIFSGLSCRVEGRGCCFRETGTFSENLSVFPEIRTNFPEIRTRCLYGNDSGLLVEISGVVVI
jgi:hypothetical protein